jgi:hypothetical protein
MTNDFRQPFSEWLLDEERQGRVYQEVDEMRREYEAAGYSSDGWVQGMNPTLNLNATSSEELMRQVVAILEALRAAQKAMMDGAPHGRDYQHDITGESYRQARAKHLSNLIAVQDLIRHYEEQQESIDNQMLEREAARKARMER